MILILIVVFNIVALATIYLRMTKSFGFFKKRGVPEVPSHFPFGCDEAAKMFMAKISFLEITKTIYKQYKKLPMVGYISMGTPVLIVNDLDLIKQILVKDFDHFVDRRQFELNQEVEVNRYFSNMLTMMNGEKWKYFRSIFSPVFTSGKLKAMTVMLNKVRNREYYKICSC